MTVAQITFAVLASICAGAALVTITRRDARSALVGLATVLLATAGLLATLGMTIAAVAQVVVYAIGATIPLLVAVGRMPGLRGRANDRGQPRLALGAALVGVAIAMLIGLAVLRTPLPDAAPLRDTAAALDAMATEIAGRRAIVFAALLMVLVAALISSGAALRPRASER